MEEKPEKLHNRILQIKRNFDLSLSVIFPETVNRSIKLYKNKRKNKRSLSFTSKQVSESVRTSFFIIKDKNILLLFLLLIFKLKIFNINTIYSCLYNTPTSLIYFRFFS